MKTKEKRDSLELRAIDGTEGEFEGYIAVWDTIDSYNSKFQRGCFKKTIQERSNKIKVFYNHEHLVGSSQEIREDDHGVYVRGKLNLAVEKAQECYAFLRDGTLDGLSFGFRTIQEGFEAGVRVIKEVQLFEYGPVIFPANSAAEIIDVRSTDFNQTIMESDVRATPDRLLSALHETIWDIWEDDKTNSTNIVSLMDDAIAKFHVAYLEAINKFIMMYWPKDSESDEEENISVEIRREIPHGNKLAIAFRSLNKSIDTLCSETSLTKNELKQLQKGQLIEKRSKLDELPEEIKKAHQEQRVAMVEKLCAELRQGLNDTEKRRIKALININDPDEITIIDANLAEVSEFFANLRSTI